jgi:dTDP-4-amino-4,6-dideoxygalactose transaminase
MFTKKCSQFLESTFDVPKALLTTNCTHALEMAALLLNVSEGDEVIVPSFTFVSTVNAFALRGARPKFIDIRPDTLNLDEKLVEGAINDHTKAIFVMHYAGVGCEMDEILRIAQKHGLPVVEDNAHGLFGKYKGQYLGTFGQIATQVSTKPKISPVVKAVRC